MSTSQYDRESSVATIGAASEFLPMSADRESDDYAAGADANSSAKTSRLISAATQGAIFLLFLGVVIGLQYLSGTYAAEFGGYPDEPAHYVTSLMLHDYLASFHWNSPLAFAQQYYHYYPKVAIGHWPPFFYVVQAVWMLLFSTSRISIRLEVAFTTALLAYSIYLQARRWFGGHSAPVLAGLLMLCLPLTQRYSDEEMAEALLVLLCFWASIYFTKYLNSFRWQDSVCFGILFSLAVLTKGNGWLLAGVVPVAVLLTRKLQVFLKWQFWIASAIVAALCLPWQIMTMRMVEDGWSDGVTPTWHYTLTAIGEFGWILLSVGGVALGSLALLGIWAKVIRPASRNQIGTGAAVMFALLICTWIFHAIVPAGVEDRKMLIAVPPLILFIFSGGYWIAWRLPIRGRLAQWRPQLVAAAGTLLFAVNGFAIPHQNRYGYADVARFITSRPDWRGESILVSDDTVGEGLLISEIAMDEPRPGNLIIRGTKALADVDWNARKYHSLYSTSDQVAKALTDLHVNLVVVDTFNQGRTFEHNRLLKQALQDGNRFRLIRTFPGEGLKGPGEILVYELKS